MRHRNTRQRQLILDELRKLKSHPTASTLLEIAREKMPSISQATVYRNLDFLARTGQVIKLNFAGEQARWDGNPVPHHHISCSECGRMDDLGDFSIDLSRAGNGIEVNYKILGHRLEVIGICSECQGNGED